jgi:7-carboxy-7-deazaguanine synthase
MQMETVYTSAAVLPVMEAFYTIQGEGFHQGKAAYFIRLGGCDVGCVWCDVKDSWDAEKHPKLEIRNIVDQALKHPAKLAVVTGGEPLMHDCVALTDELHKAGFTTNIETSGSYP